MVAQVADCFHEDNNLVFLRVTHPLRCAQSQGSWLLLVIRLIPHEKLKLTIKRRPAITSVSQQKSEKHTFCGCYHRFDRRAIVWVCAHIVIGLWAKSRSHEHAVYLDSLDLLTCSVKIP